MSEYIYTNEGITRIFEKSEDSDKCIICACAKNEDEYIEEWVSHHLSIGFDKILIADNNDEFGHLNKILKDYIEDGKVQVFNFSGLKYLQLPFYQMIINSKNYEWVALFDIDEFLELSPEYSNVKQLLSEINEDCLLINWLIYGPNGQLDKKEGLVQERFKLPLLPISMTKENYFFKPIISKKAPKCRFSSSHEPIFETKGSYNVGGYNTVESVFQTSYPPRYKKAWLKHYYTKSFDEYRNKMRRGWPDGNDEKTLNDIKHFYPLNSSINVDLTRFSKNIFDDEDHTFITRVIKDYDVIFMRGRTQPNAYYSLIYELSNAMSKTTGYTYCIDENVDENMYMILFEIALRTGNRLVATKEEKCWDIYCRYAKKNVSYYIIY